MRRSKKEKEEREKKNSRGFRKWGRRTLKLRESQGGGALRNENIKEEEIAEKRDEDFKG